MTQKISVFMQTRRERVSVRRLLKATNPEPFLI
jgi:hypothetical protein